MTAPLLIGVEEAAQRLGVSTRTLHDWVLLKKAPPSARIGRRRYFKPADIDEWVEQHFREQNP